MAEGKDDSSKSSSESGHDVAIRIILIALIVFAFARSIENHPVFGPYARIITGYFDGAKSETDDGDGSNQNGAGEDSPALNWEEGKAIIAKATLDVRQSPAGSIIGSQKGGEKGTIKEGPVRAYQEAWWYVDFPKSPDGWVSQKEISDNFGLYGVYNFFPRLFDKLRFLFWALGILVILFIVYVIIKAQRLKKINIEKKKMKFEMDDVYGSAKQGEEKNQTRFVLNQNAVREGSLAPKDLTVNQDIYDYKEVKVASSADSKDYLNNLKNKYKTGDSKQSEVDFENSPDFQPSDLPVPNLPVGEAPAYEKHEEPDGRWSHVQRQIRSHNSNDWRQAIIEADIILGEMLKKMGYQGETIGDMLKQVDQKDFLTLNDAWEAHKARNLIAHRGADYVLSKDEAEKIVRQYEKVFQEFFYI